MTSKEPHRVRTSKEPPFHGDARAGCNGSLQLSMMATQARFSAGVLGDIPNEPELGSIQGSAARDATIHDWKIPKWAVQKIARAVQTQLRTAHRAKIFQSEQGDR